MSNDRAQMTDAVSASLEVEAVSAAYPCPKCGAETREHGEAPRHDESERVCSAAACRKVQPAPEEVERKLHDEGPRFPCAECGRETKQYRSGRAGHTAQRVCSSAVCRNIFST